MPKLYFTPTSCGAATFIASKKGGIKFDETNVVSFPEHKLLKDGSDFYAINPKGNVPALLLDDGTLLNENTGTLYWVGKTGSGNLLGHNMKEEVDTVNMLGFLASEVHKAFAPLFSAKDEESKKQYKERLFKQLQFIEDIYLNEEKEYLVGDSFTVADSYLYVMLHWPPDLIMQD